MWEQDRYKDSLSFSFHITSTDCMCNSADPFKGANKNAETEINYF